MSLAPGTTFGRYRLIRAIGRGGEATVYLAHDPRLDRSVALKVFPPAVGAGPVAPPEGFRKEVEALSRLRHPGLCAIHDAGVDDGAAYIAMSFVEGETLAERAGRDGSVPAAEAVAIAAEVAATVAAAHAVGIVHGDLTPANILVTPEGRAVVLDFGVARFLDASPAATRPGRTRGTLPYLAPECLARSPDARSDVFALGAVLFRLVAGTAPFSAPTHAALVARLRREDAPLLRSLSAPASRDLEAVLAKALDRNPDRRYRTVDDLGADLRRLESGESVVARRLGALARAARWARRRPAAAALVAFAFVFLAAVACVSVIKNRHLREELDAAEFEETRASTGLRAAQESSLRYERLADLRRVRDLEASAAALVPPSPALVPALRSWLGEADALARGLDEHRRVLAALWSRSRAESGPLRRAGAAGRLSAEIDELKARLPGVVSRPVADRRLRGLIARLESELPPPVERRAFEDSSDAWHEEMLAALVGELERFADPGRFHGTMADVAQRLDDVRRMEDARVMNAAAWTRACRSIADAAECPRYSGMHVEPQLGLVPLRRDPATGLWEFLNVLSGEAPREAGDGGFAMRPESGIVLVLLPGCVARVGARRPEPGEPSDAPHVDPMAAPSESPIDDVPLDPFFISKYEMTQAQWARVRGVVPGAAMRGTSRPETRDAGTRPVTLISWNEARDVLDRLGLAIPTEAQWEFAARAGTTTPWWTGTDAASLRSAAVFKTAEPDLVGSRAPNAFGLHDVAGNVAEWCRDVYARYDDPRVAGTGERFGLDERQHRMRRGGSHPNGPSELRVARRDLELPDARLNETGVRPSRKLDR